MAGSRPDKSTISPVKDPLANVHYQQPSPPINGLIADTTAVEAKPTPESVPHPARGRSSPPPAPDRPPPKEKITVVLPAEMLERLRNASYWKRKSLAELAEDGIQLVLARLERENSGPFESREEPLRPGRRQGMKGAAAKGR